MNCAWQSYLELLPHWLRYDVDKLGRDDLEELRLRIDGPPELVLHDRTVFLSQKVTKEDLNFCISIASKYSPWTSMTAGKGYITAGGGHRIGICGSAIMKNGEMTGIRSISSLCIRVARVIPGIAKCAAGIPGSILIIGSPGTGKTTLLRDLIQQKATKNGICVSVVDEREELFPKNGDVFCFPPGNRVDVLTGCGKSEGVEAVLRSMGPDMIAVDEITAEEDCNALLKAGWCGVKLLATAHARDKTDLFQRPVYKTIVDKSLFDTLIILDENKNWHTERMV